MNKILFDASSTDPVSATIYVAPGSCVLISAWNLALNEVAEVFRLQVAPGAIPGDVNGSSCGLAPNITPSEILEESPYIPCNAPVLVGVTPTQQLSSIVLSQPGYYNLHLTPAALGTAVVEAQFLTGEDACAQAANTCCCEPQLQWAGSSANPCLTITPGGPLGNEPVFDLDACCLVQQIANVVVPDLSDRMILLQGGACGVATLQDVFNLVNTCATLAGFPLGAYVALDSLVTIDSGANCKRLDAAVMVTTLETPWTGTSLNANLTITPGGVNGHAPVFDYDWCGDMQALPSCTCEPNPGDGVAIIQGGACVLATWPVVDVCDQIAALTVGTLIAGDNVPVIEAGGACKLVPATDFAGGGATFPLLGPDGSCASPTYSFTSSTDSGMFYDVGLGAVVIGDDNCTDFIQIGASIVVTAGVGNIAMSSAAATIATAGTGILLTALSGNVVAAASASFVVQTAATNRLAIDNSGAWLLAGSAGTPLQVLTSNGPGLPVTWETFAATVTFPLLAPTSATPQYSFSAQPGMGMAMDGSQLHYGSLDPVSPVWGVSSRLSIDTGVTGDMFLRGSRGDGSRGANIDIHGGDALNPGIQVEGGGVSVTGGNSTESNGGTVTLGGGSSTGSGAGGNAVILAGNAVTGGGGSVSITAGVGSAAAAGGNIRLRTNHLNVGTPAAITMDHHGSVQYGDPYVFAAQAHASGTSFWYGVSGEAASTRGQNIRIWAGHGLNGGAGGNGGDLDLRGGNATAGAAHDGGQLFLKGGDLNAGGIQGYVHLQRVAAAPVAAPNLTAGYAPIVLFDDGANIHLYAWSVGAGAWQSVMLA